MLAGTEARPCRGRAASVAWLSRPSTAVLRGVSCAPNRERDCLSRPAARMAWPPAPLPCEPPSPAAGEAVPGGRREITLR